MNARVQLSIPIALLIVVLATAGTFWRVVGFDFTTWDDNQTVSHNADFALAADRALRDFWTRPQVDLYVPVTYSLWMITASVARETPPPSAGAPPGAFVLNPRWFHGLNLLLHTAVACFVLLLLRELVPDTFAATAGALLFALHPLQVETMSWVSGTKDLLFALLALVSLWQYVKFAKLSKASKAAGETVLPGERLRLLGVATVALVLAMLAKPTAVVTPFIAIAIDWLIVRRALKDVLRTIWPWLVLIVPCLIWTKLCQPAAGAHATALAIWQRPMIALDALAFYFWKLVVPARLAIDYGRTPLVVLQRGWIYWMWIAPVLCGIALAWLAVKKGSVPLVGGLIAVIALAPILGFVPFDFQSYSTVADHYFYLPMFGIALAVAWLIARWPSRVSSLAASIMVLVLAICSQTQATHWRDSHALFTHALEVNHDSYVSYTDLALDALGTGRINDAIDLSRHAIAIAPSFGPAHAVLAEVLRTGGDIDGAIAEYTEAAAHSPNDGAVLMNLAALLAKQGRVADALPFAERSVTATPDSAVAHLNLARIDLLLDRSEYARRELTIVVELDPSNGRAKALLAQLEPAAAP